MGVERQYSGTLGKVGNCQVAVSLHHVGEQGSTVLGWRLYLPESWAKDSKPSRGSGHSGRSRFLKRKWQLSLDMIDQVRAWGLANRIVVADAGYGDTTEFREELEARHLPYVVGISSTTGVWSKPPKAQVPHYQGRGRSSDALRSMENSGRPRAGRRGSSEGLEDNSLAARRSKGWLESRFVAVRVQPSNGFVRGQPPHKEICLLIEWPKAEKEPT